MSNTIDRVNEIIDRTNTTGEGQAHEFEPIGDPPNRYCSAFVESNRVRTFCGQLRDAAIHRPASDTQDVPPELKACPFCGADAAIYHHGVDYDGSHQIDVGCSGGCVITPRVCGSDDPDAEQNEQWAIEEWNTRTTSTAEGLAEALRSFFDASWLWAAYHINVEEGNYLQCRFCRAESPGGVVAVSKIEHAAHCLIVATGTALARYEGKECYEGKE